MALLTTREKLAILSDAAKYDASCASSGAEKRDSRKTGGIGLGLSVARSIARSHGGDLVLRNRPGGGLTARATLPV